MTAILNGRPENRAVIPAWELIGKGPDLVLIPGTFADRRTWSRVIGRLAARFRCLLLDPRGTHQTPDPGTAFSADDLAGDVLAAMEAAGLERANVAGHSLGAAVAVILAARHPRRVDRLVACSPAAGADAYQLAVLDLWDALATGQITRHALHLGLVIPTFGRGAFENGTVRAIVDEMDRRPLDTETIRRYVECDRNIDLRPLMKDVDAATLVIAGAEDALTGVAQARLVAEAISGARLEIIDGIGHGPHLEAPMTFARLVTEFLLKRPYS
jgi:3-oxoadipate enol-lactonase